MDSYLLFNHKVNRLLLAGLNYADIEVSKQPHLDVLNGRQKLWLKHLKSKKPLILFIGGASNTGKSSWAIELAFRLGVRNLVHTDTLRNTLRAFTPKRRNPALFLSTYDCWRAAARSYSTQALIKGFQAQCESLTSAIDAVIDDAQDYGKVTLIEGIHLMPSLLKKRKDCRQLFIMLDVPDESVHVQRLDVRCQSSYLNRNPKKYHTRFNAFRDLHDYLTLEARRHKCARIQNIGKDETLDQCMSVIFKYLKQS